MGMAGLGLACQDIFYCLIESDLPTWVTCDEIGPKL